MTRIVNRLPCLVFTTVDIKARLTTSGSCGTFFYPILVVCVLRNFWLNGLIMNQYYNEGEAGRGERASSVAEVFGEALTEDICKCREI